MKKQITKEQYIAIDMVILSIITCILLWAGMAALKVFSKELFAISVVLPMTLIAMMRHGALGISLAALGGLVYCILNKASLGVYPVYIAGNSFIALNLLWFGNGGKDRVRANLTLTVLYVITGYLLMNTGRSVMAYIMGYRPFVANTIRYFTTDALTAVMSVIIILIAKKQDGVFEDQMEYLRRLAAEEEQTDGGKE